MNSPCCTGRSVLAKSGTSLIGLLACRPPFTERGEAEGRAFLGEVAVPDPATPRQRASLSQRKDLPEPHAPRRDDGKHASPGFAGQHIGGAGASKREKPDLQIKRS